jgi:hypothetical protein
MFLILKPSRSHSPHSIHSVPEPVEWVVPKLVEWAHSVCHSKKKHSLPFLVTRSFLQHRIRMRMNRDLSLENMLGHKRIANTQHYAKIIDKKLEEDMKALEGRLRF